MGTLAGLAGLTGKEKKPRGPKSATLASKCAFDSLDILGGVAVSGKKYNTF